MKARRFIVDRLEQNLLRSPFALKSALRLAAARGRRLILLYHRIGDRHSSDLEVVPMVQQHVFSEHLKALRQLGDIVPLADLIDPNGSTHRVQFAITFDDDHPNHVRFALPVLKAEGAHATFFLSGRSLHDGLGPYWFDVLEAAMSNQGVERVAKELELHVNAPQDIAAACEGRMMSSRVLELFGKRHKPAMMSHDDIVCLAKSGMEIGFHTLHHPLLTEEPHDTLLGTLSAGKTVLENAIGRQLSLFAYPFGKENVQVQRRVAEAGYRAAFTNRGFPIRASRSRFGIGRFDVRERNAQDLTASVAFRLSMPAR